MPVNLTAIDALRDSMGDDFKDIRLNVSSVLTGENLDPATALGIALASARFIRSETLTLALTKDIHDNFGDSTDAEAKSAADIISDATAVAGLMAMNTTYYRFRHMLSKETYDARPPRLRMSRMAQPATDKITFELMSLACAALAGCELCIKNHEGHIVAAGTSEDTCHDAIRIASVMNAAAVATL